MPTQQERLQRARGERSLSYRPAIRHSGAYTMPDSDAVNECHH
jgi:hypothetical protein